MRTPRIAVTIAAAALAVGGASGVALAHGPGGAGRGPGGPGPGGGPGSGVALQCTVPAGQQLTVTTSAALRRLKARLERRVAAGKITQAQADARFEAAATRLSVQKLVATARQKPLLDLLAITADDLAAAREEGVSLLELAEENGITSDRLIAALREGRAAAEATRDALCTPVDEEEDTTTTTTAAAA